MSLVVAAMMITTASAPVAAQAHAPQPTAIATVQASARVLRPARISFSVDAEDSPESHSRDYSSQRGRDANGTVWIEFS